MRISSFRKKIFAAFSFFSPSPPEFFHGVFLFPLTSQHLLHTTAFLVRRKLSPSGWKLWVFVPYNFVAAILFIVWKCEPIATPYGFLLSECQRLTTVRCLRSNSLVQHWPVHFAKTHHSACNAAGLWFSTVFHNAHLCRSNGRIMKGSRMTTSIQRRQIHIFMG